MIFFFFLAVLFSLVAALPVVQRDVWVPTITYPDNTTVWAAGYTYNVTWDTSNKPTQVSNPNGEVYLRIGGATQSSPIVQGFPLALGVVNVTIPRNTPAAPNWEIVLMGDSGNWSPPFQIVAPLP